MNCFFFVKLVDIQDGLHLPPVKGDLLGPLLGMLTNKRCIEALAKIEVVPTCQAIRVFDPIISSMI